MTFANWFLSYYGNIWSSFLATLTRCLFCSSVNRCGTHLADFFFLTFKCFSKIRWTVDSDMPIFRAISRTVNLASPWMISFILETISLRDADFGLPDFGAFFMYSTPDSDLFFHRRTVIRHTRTSISSRKFSISFFKEQLSFEWALM